VRFVTGKDIGAGVDPGGGAWRLGSKQAEYR
jgi:hypothetical protein